MDKIIMKNLGFYGYHGVLKEENKLGQKFFIDVEMYLNLEKAGKTDDVNDTISYAETYKVVKKIVENENHNLLEKIAQRICNELFKDFEKIDEIKVKIRKPEAPVHGIYDYFGIEIRRKRNEIIS
ncbi:7,8-dihydroneopterin aldolase [Tepiditoga spiralis]|uniref:7,8-dihydroneopterin aldolase n=1 Tax=Tepiditoga spiralis TaxID=2108365 RepID=A0A7G1GBE6_9BACT|nr:dihydroneopterin aldolase [Tepiditoga spiralis]BBE31722.1 7,8-dihydroneopterin aldolase [Tepiditoga spiralis]